MAAEVSLHVADALRSEIQFRIQGPYWEAPDTDRYDKPLVCALRAGVEKLRSCYREIQLTGISISLEVPYQDPSKPYSLNPETLDF